jgi:small subunit ribosomal protein S20
MANHISSLKRMRITERRTAVNKVRKSRMKNAIRLIRRAIEKKDTEGAGKLLPSTFSMVDRAAKWGVIKVNTANRYKSRIHARLKALQGTPA